jgi:hypothetical protein
MFKLSLFSSYFVIYITREITSTMYEFTIKKRMVLPTKGNKGLKALQSPALSS